MSTVPNTLSSILGRVKVVGEMCCWKLVGLTPYTKGYIRVSFHGRAYRAHRFIYKQLIGPIPQGKTLDHLCRHRWWCHPNHNSPVTPAENTRRGGNTHKRSCPAGHRYTNSNTRICKDGSRKCRACHRANENRRYHRRRS